MRSINWHICRHSFGQTHDEWFFKRTKSNDTNIDVNSNVPLLGPLTT